MSKKKSLPTVALQSVFVRDHQRRLRLVIELLEKEARRQSTPPTNLQSHTKNARAEMIEELVWQAVSELLRNPQILIDQYNQRQESDYGTPEQQEQQRLKRRMAGLKRESQRLIDAYQSGIIELDDLKERRERVAEECRRLEERLSSLEQQRQGQQRTAAALSRFLFSRKSIV